MTDYDKKKKKLLISLDDNLNEAKLDQLINQDGQKMPPYRYGVKMKSKDWTELVNPTLSDTRDMMKMDEYEKKLNNIFNNIIKKL